MFWAWLWGGVKEGWGTAGVSSGARGLSCVTSTPELYQKLTGASGEAGEYLSGACDEAGGEGVVDVTGRVREVT